jgi:hypothetical protein
MSLLSRLTSFAVRCRDRAFRLRQERIRSRLSPEGRERFSALLRSYPEYADSLWRIADRLSHTEAEWHIDIRRAPGLAVVEIRFLDPSYARIRLLPHSLRRLLDGAERAELDGGACLYRLYFSEGERARSVQSPRRPLRRAGR